MSVDLTPIDAIEVQNAQTIVSEVGVTCSPFFRVEVYMNIGDFGEEEA
jgi:hypothetical protein